MPNSPIFTFFMVKTRCKFNARFGWDCLMLFFFDENILKRMIYRYSHISILIYNYKSIFLELGTQIGMEFQKEQ